MLAVSCSRTPLIFKTEGLNKWRQLATFAFNPETPLWGRVGPMPDCVLEQMRIWDGRNDYGIYLPGPKEEKIIRECLDLLPEYLSSALKTRCAGIYFISNLAGSGWTDWLLDEKNNIYCYMAFPGHVLSGNLSSLLSAKEKTCFRDSDITIKIECGTEYPGFLYILLHEAAHVYDYTVQVTPWVEKTLKNTGHINMRNSVFTKNIWEQYNLPVKKFDFPGRTNISFYGFSGGPKLESSRSPEIYKAASRSCFPSLYASMNWAEDFAEMAAFYHLHDILGQPYKIIVSEKNSILWMHEPFLQPGLRDRLGLMRSYYK